MGAQKITSVFLNVWRDYIYTNEFIHFELFFFLVKLIVLIDFFVQATCAHMSSHENKVSVSSFEKYYIFGQF